MLIFCQPTFQVEYIDSMKAKNEIAKGQFTRKVNVPVSMKMAMKVQHCVFGERAFDR